MSNVIPFHPLRRDNAQQNPIPQENRGEGIKTAQILLFMGVRYERHEEVPPPAPKVHKKSSPSGKRGKRVS